MHMITEFGGMKTQTFWKWCSYISMQTTKKNDIWVIIVYDPEIVPGKSKDMFIWKHVLFGKIMVSMWAWSCVCVCTWALDNDIALLNNSHRSYTVFELITLKVPLSFCCSIPLTHALCNDTLLESKHFSLDYYNSTVSVVRLRHDAFS